MPKYNKQNIDRKTNKPSLKQTEGLTPDLVLNRAMQTRRDNDVIRSPKRTAYDIDYAIKWYIENEIQPQITANEEVINVPVIFANGEKWDNVRRLGYIRDEKGMLQSPLIMLKRNSITEQEQHRSLDVNRPQSANQIVYRQPYNERNRYEDKLFPIPTNEPQPSEKIYIVDIPKYVTIEYDMMIWCDFTTQLNDLIDQILPYGRFAWGNDANKFATTIGSITFETVNTVGEDRLVRASVPLTVIGTLLSAQESRIETIRKMYSIKKVNFDTTVSYDIFKTTKVPNSILQSGGGSIILDDNTVIKITTEIMNYLINLTDQLATYVNSDTATVNAAAAINPVNNAIANVNEFDIYINGQYIDKNCYTWTPSTSTPQTITFNTGILGYSLDVNDVIVVHGRWA